MRHRSGFLMVEVVAAVLLLGVAIVLAVRLVGASGADQVASRHRRIALAEAQNALDRLAVLAPAELTAEQAELPELSERVARELPGGRLVVRLDPTEGPPSGVRIRAEVHYRNRQGRPVAPVQLTTWSFGPRQEAAP